MTDPIAIGARAAAQRLALDHGPGLVLEVEAALHERRSRQSSDQYLDPVSLGSFIVSVSTLAWTIYLDLRKKTPNPPPEVVARTVHIELEKRSDADPGASDQIVNVVVTETIKATNETR
jgi:hypothetical protein